MSEPPVERKPPLGPPPYSPPPAPKSMESKVRVGHLAELKRLGRPITMLTAYDAGFAALADASGIDSILVGDSVGMVVHGYDSTIPVTMDQMVMHCAAVRRGAKRALVVGDMPFLSYHADVNEAVRNAGRLVKEGGAEAVKLESPNARSLATVEAIVGAGIPVMGHIGLVPQAVHALSGYKVQGREDTAGERLRTLARALEAAGAFAIVLEAVPAPLGEAISSELKIPTIGIGAGVGCDGQVLVMHDLLGYTEKPARFVRKYADLRNATLRAFRKFARDVREKRFPGSDESYE